MVRVIRANEILQAEARGTTSTTPASGNGGNGGNSGEPRFCYFLHGQAFTGGFLMAVAPLADGCCAVDVESRQCRSLLLRRFATLSLNGTAARQLSQRLRKKELTALFVSLCIDSDGTMEA